MYDLVRNEMTKYYRKMDESSWKSGMQKETREKFYTLYQRIFLAMDEFYSKNRAISPALLKSKLHTLMAELCEPIVFTENPFFFELSYNASRSRGVRKQTPSNWFLRTRNDELLENYPSYAETVARFKPYFDRVTNNLCSHDEPFDLDHHSLGYTKLFSVGVKGLIAEAELRRKTLEKGTDAYDFCSAVIESCHAVILIAHKFAEKAEQLLLTAEGEAQHANLQLIAATARKIPENPPETFYEGLAMLLFMRETVATLENIGVSQLGHVDRLLGDLYRRDREADRIDEAEARRLIRIWMMHTDIKFDAVNNKWPETSACIQLGGCDAEGNVVFNEVTRMFVEEHQRENLLNPKLNCRYFESSPKEYLELIGKAVIAGHNNFALMNDDAIIGGLVANGVQEKDARLYVSGGCQETIIEGFGHTEGVALYFSLLRIFDAFLREDKTVALITPFDGADTFEEFYQKFLASFKSFFDVIIDQRNYRQSFYKNALSFPLFSATQEGCIQNGKDYTAGGAKYNFSTVAFVGFANVVDSLYTIKKLVYEQNRLGIKEFVQILERNWEDYEAFRCEVIALPKYGHNHQEVDGLAKRFLADFGAITKNKKNERGGIHLPSLFAYSFTRTFAPCLRATPDGRKDYDYVAASCAPSNTQAIKDVTQPIKSMRNIDLSTCGGAVAVLDIMLPATPNFNEETFCALLKASSKCGCVVLQPNMVSLDDLIKAKAEPENYKNLIVRICGLSAYFTALTPEVQDEIIHRNFYS